MKFRNGWKYLFKDADRFEVKLRISTVTVIDLLVDIGDRKFKLTLMNFTLETDKKQAE